MKIYTKTGDKGFTSLYTGERVEKNSVRVQVYGAIDEADSALGIARAFVEVDAVREKIFAVQKLLPKLMADFASLNREPTITFDDVKNLETEMDALENSLPPLKEFLIPGKTKGGKSSRGGQNFSKPPVGFLFPAHAQGRLERLKIFCTLNQSDNLLNRRGNIFCGDIFFHGVG